MTFHRFISRTLSLAFVVVALPSLADPFDKWTIVPSGTTNFLWSVAFGNGLFVATGDSGTILTSSNGQAWTPAASGVTNSLRGVTYGQGQFIAVGQAGAIITSTNGTDWSAQVSGTANRLNAVTLGGFGFIAVGLNGTVLLSTNGTQWLAAPAFTSAELVGVGNGFGKTFVGARGNTPALFSSANGTSWSTLGEDLFNGNFVYGNGVVLGIAIRGQFYRNPDGASWSLIAQSPFVYCWGLAFARNQFVGVGGSFFGPGRTIATSINGTNWVTRYNKSSEGRLQGVAYGNQRFVAVGDAGGILVSDPIVWFSNQSVAANALHLTLDAEPGTPFRLQSATNLSPPNWTDIGTVTNTDEADEIIIPYSQNFPNAFYRVTTP
jgi:hypothetical protein